MLERARRVGPPLVLLAALVAFAVFLDGFYPLRQWLFFRYAGYWVAVAVWALGCLSVGHLVVRALSRVPLPPTEHVVASFAAGVLAFYVLMSAAGALGLFGTAWFFALPLGMLAAGGVSLGRWLSRCRRHFGGAATRAERRSPLAWLPWLFGLAGLAMVYFVILTPENVQFDARWQHLALAEQYAHVGGVRRFGEGWMIATNPHLASLLYTWAFLLPWGRLFDRVELAAHIEFVALLFTLAAIPPAVRRLVPGARAAGSWAALFLFPGIFLYDSSLAGGADHIAALFALPIFLQLLRVLPRLEPRGMALLALVLAGGAMTKVTALLLFLPGVLLALALRVLWLGVGRAVPGVPRANAWRGPLAALAAGLAVTSPFWLRNWLWYGDPLYPSLHAVLSPRPWTADAANSFEWAFKDAQSWKPAPGLAGLVENLKILFTYSFVPHDWARFHGDVPVFGSLFSILSLSLPFLRPNRRLWGLVGCVGVALLVWYRIHHQDRYLQTILPWMAAATAATMVLLWRRGWLTRTLLGGLVLLQVVWGGDVWFLPNHGIIGSPVKKVADLLSAGFRKDYEARFEGFAPWPEVSAALPSDATVLLHDHHTHLGLARATVSDWPGWQFGLSYGRLGSPQDVWQAYRELGVTHLVWGKEVSKGSDSLAGDLNFFETATRFTEPRQLVGGQLVAKLPEIPPSSEAWTEVLVLGCKGLYPPGLYRREQLTVPVHGPENRSFPQPLEPAGADAETLTRQAERAGALVLDPHCPTALPADVLRRFDLVARRPLVNPERTMRRPRGDKGWELWLRK